MDAETQLETQFEESVDIYGQLIKARRINRNLTNWCLKASVFFVVSVALGFFALFLRPKPEAFGLKVAGQTAQAVPLHRLSESEYMQRKQVGRSK
jgi:hypothetical protein